MIVTIGNTTIILFNNYTYHRNTRNNHVIVGTFADLDLSGHLRCRDDELEIDMMNEKYYEK